MKSPFLVCAAFAAMAAGASAQCEGDGPVLEIPTTISIGETVHICMHTPFDGVHLVELFASLGSGPTDLGSYGTACVSLGSSLIFDQVFDVDASGTVCVDVPLACDPALVGLTIYTQFISCGDDPRITHHISNMVTIQITDGLLLGDMATFTQGGWGTKCSGENPGCRRDEWFATVFPDGVVLGDADGIDGDSAYALCFSSSAAVQAFLPAGKTAGVLKADAKDPKKSAAGVFAGQLLAAKLNVAFDAAGAFDSLKNRDDVFLGDLVFISGVHDALLGWTVQDVIDLADEAISGALGSAGIDLDGDLVIDLDFSDLSGALAALNEEFDNGTTKLGNIGFCTPE